jgi:hypothetical protein
MGNVNHESRQPDTWMFHESEAPAGKIFHVAEVIQLKAKGWVDTPAKFGKGFRVRYRKSLLAVRTFWTIVFPKGK